MQTTATRCLPGRETSRAQGAPMLARTATVALLRRASTYKATPRVIASAEKGKGGSGGRGGNTPMDADAAARIQSAAAKANGGVVDKGSFAARAQSAAARNAAAGGDSDDSGGDDYVYDDDD